MCDKKFLKSVCVTVNFSFTADSISLKGHTCLVASVLAFRCDSFIVTVLMKCIIVNMTEHVVLMLIFPLKTLVKINRILQYVRV